LLEQDSLNLMFVNDSWMSGAGRFQPFRASELASRARMTENDQKQWNEPAEESSRKSIDSIYL
jgi:hypothetical protein